MHGTRSYIDYAKNDPKALISEYRSTALLLGTAGKWALTSKLFRSVPGAVSVDVGATPCSTGAGNLGEAKGDVACAALSPSACMAMPSPATHGILSVLEAGESVFLIFFIDKHSVAIT